MLEMWFKESLIFRFVLAFLETVKHSFTGRLVERAGAIIVNSKTASCLRFIANRKFKPENSFFYRLAERVNRRSTGFRDRMAIAMKESKIYRVLSNSKSFSIIDLLLIPMVALYPFIDEIGRDLLGGFYLFGLWDEVFLLICGFYVFAVWFFRKRGEPLVSTPAGPPMLLLISVSLCLYLLNSTYPQLGFEGMRVVIQYLLWYFILNSYLTDDKKAYLIIRLLVYAGGIMGIHGIIQYILKVPTPASWTDYAEGSTGTRVFSIVGSPNILGSIFILMIPLCLALLLQKRRGFTDRLVFFVLLGAMGLSLVLTLSRGAWFGAAIAMFIFCLAVNPRWLFILGAGGGVMLFVPSVMSRITYMLSPQYKVNSMTGGRLLRYQTGWDMFMQNKLKGVGLGHFGGAVAMNNINLVPDTFYMDNYWLKTAVEMGIIGVAAFAVLIFVLVFWSIRAVKQSEDYDTRLVTAGGFAGLCGVIFHNLMENVFEVQYMVAYFWVIAALVFYFGIRRKKVLS
jgi:O-antigen ligase